MTIDWWTLGFQVVNVVVLVWLLQRFFWRPIAAMIDQRRNTTQKALADAEATRAKAAADLADIDKVRAGFAAERDAILAKAHVDADAARTASLADAAKQAAALESAAKAAIEKEKTAAEKAWSERSCQLAVDIAGHLAARLEGPVVQAAFLEWLVKEIGNLPAATRQAVAANGTALEAVSATALDPADQERASGRIAKALGGEPAIAFRTDPALIAGLELHGPHFQVSNSWQADLAKILAGLKHEA